MNKEINVFLPNNNCDTISKMWSILKIENYLRYHEIDEDIIDIFSAHKIDGIAFAQLKESDLLEMEIKTIGIRKKLIYLMKKWIHCEWSNDYLKELEVVEKKRTKCISEGAPTTVADSELLSNCNMDFGKLFVSFLYVFLVFGISAFVMVLAHERLPDMTKYPPLPDLILDNVPYIPWAFEAAEMVAVLLLIIWLSILACHKYRFVLLRRFFTMIGTVFLLRSVTMIITSLSVPGTHLHGTCVSSHPSIRDKVYRAVDIWLGLGLSLNGVRTCGDYMFSGHTSCLTLLNFFITEYTPRTFYPLHTFTWILNLFGIFFILAAHEHYSIDVFVAFYLSSRLFLYYHWQANNYSLMTRDHQRARIWFPMFTWFEANCPCTIPHQYERPFASLFARFNNCVYAKANKVQ